MGNGMFTDGGLHRTVWMGSKNNKYRDGVDGPSGSISHDPELMQFFPWPVLFIEQFPCGILSPPRNPTGLETQQLVCIGWF
jgi:hypothetical protein